jgi:hypothetical protein
MTLFIRATSPDEEGTVEKNSYCCHNNVNSSNTSSSSSLHRMFFGQDTLRHWFNLDKADMLILDR